MSGPLSDADLDAIEDANNRGSGNSIVTALLAEVRRLRAAPLRYVVVRDDGMRPAAFAARVSADDYAKSSERPGGHTYRVEDTGDAPANATRAAEAMRERAAKAASDPALYIDRGPRGCADNAAAAIRALPTEPHK